MTLAAHRNRHLFSNHFLEVRLRQDSLWQEVEPAAEEVRRQIRALYEGQRAPLEGASEAQTEERWVQPLLRILSWGYEVQPVSQRQGTTQFPDYALFPTQDDADRAASAIDRRRVLKEAIGVLEAKRWQRDLDTRDPEGADQLNQVPSVQIINYLIRAEQPWGILTNGAEWRLYYRDADFADTTYFAVDLPALLGDAPLPIGEKGETIPAAEAFRYFYLFFRAESFRIEAEARRWLDGAYQASVSYARAVEGELKPRAYEAVEALCRGFAVAHGIEPVRLESDDALRTVLLDNALTLLFRLLFLLYSESRDLLPVRTNPAYRQKSLIQLRERAAAQRDSRSTLFPRGRDFWNDLHDLFRIVDGDPAWSAVGIPVYNGGLFDPDQHPWLEDHYVADPQMAEAIDLLSRTPVPGGGGMHYVDYGPLDVRNLGSIYEGLLEHRIQADEQGRLFLANEKGERKATGSYYTPHYIVEYVVEKSLRPLVEGRTPAGILTLKVLDPAMGSGHFLVSATSYLVRAAVSAVEEEQGALGELARLDPDQLRRLVVERCIFGVDKNPRAVELAKLSLWIATVQRDKPLNFLDHHLKCGDSLLGARIAQLARLPGRRGKEARMEAAGQVNAFESAFRTELVGILDSISAIESRSSDTLSDVKRKEELYLRADTLTSRFRDVADLWSSIFFGNTVSGDHYDRAIQALHGYPGEWEEVAREEWMRDGARLAEEHRFFHWDLEFGEIFFEETGSRKVNPGFDAVIGNPPYVRMEAFKKIKPFLRANYAAHAERADLYVYFVERSLDLLREGGEYGVIVSNKFLRANYGKALRAKISERAFVREIVDFGELPVFEEAATMPALLFVIRGTSEGTPRFAQISTLDFADLGSEIETRAFNLDPESFSGDTWLLVPRTVMALLRKMESQGQALGPHVGGQICWGIKTGFNEAFFIDQETREGLVREDPASAEVIKPLVVGTEVRRYRLERAGSWIIYLPHGVEISRYPAIERHLSAYRSQLEQRATEQEWHELQQPQEAYVPYFEGPKILYPDIGLEARFAAHPGPLYPANTCFFVPGEDFLLLAHLNSRLCFWYLQKVALTLGDPAERGRVRFFKQYLERLPVRKIEETTPQDARRELGAWLRSFYFRGLRLAGIEPEIPDDIRDLGAQIGTIEGVERILLIGSWARGEAQPDSDVDLLIVHRPDGNKAEQRSRIRERLEGYGRIVDLHVYTTAEIREQSEAAAGFLSQVLAEAVVLHGNG